MANPTGKGGFQERKGQINRKGRPKSFDALRTLAQDIAHEEARQPDGQAITINGKTATITEAILRKWATSKDPRLQIMFMEVCYGKVPQETILSGKEEGDAIQVKFVDYRAGLDGSSETEK
jgi:hypothetical protein